MRTNLWIRAAMLSGLAACSQAASIVTVNATCPQGQAVVTASMATCAGNGDLAQALGGEFSVSAFAYRAQWEGFNVPRASASFSGGYLLTFFGGSGAGLYVPLIGVSVTGDTGQSAAAMVKWNDLLLYRDTTLWQGVLCPNAEACGLAFTFGQPFHVEIDLFARAYADGLRTQSFTTASASFNGFSVFAPGQSDFSYTLVPNPEPRTWLLTLLGLAFLSIKGYRNHTHARFRTRHTGE